MNAFSTVVVLVVATVATTVAQGPPQSGPAPLVRAPGETPVAGKCLFKEDVDLIESIRALTRTTLNNDAPTPFNPDYLVGTWTFEYDAPESALGPSGQISGTETVRHVDGCLYEGATQAKGPTGAFTIKSTMTYDPSAHYLVVLERDSRGFEVLKYGRVGGDSGGFFTHHWAAAPLTVEDKSVRLRGTTFMSSPVAFRERTEIAEGDDPFVSMGTVWKQKQGTPVGR